MVISKRKNRLGRGIVPKEHRLAAKNSAQNKMIKKMERECPYCKSSDMQRKGIGYVDIAGEISNYRGDLMGFESADAILDAMLNQELRPCEFVCNACNKYGVVIYTAGTNDIKFFYSY